MDDRIIFAFIPIIAIIGGLTLAALKVYQAGKIRELELRERIAMIERGLVPPPEVDPARFERVMGGHERWYASSDVRAERHRTAGVMMLGVGLALMLLIAFTSGEEEVGIGVGGAIAMLGAAFLVNSYLSSQRPGPPLRDISPHSRPPQGDPPPPPGAPL